MTIDQLRFFIAVARYKSFTYAAESLYISQSSISKAIIALEAELGAPLFDRSKKQVELTVFGSSLIDEAIHLEQQYTDFVKLAKQKIALGRKQINIVSYPFLHQYRLHERFAEFNQAYPNITLNILEPDDYDVVRMLERDLFDFAIVRDTKILAPEYDGIYLVKDHLAAYLSEENPLSRSGTIAIKELREQPLLMMKEGMPLHTIAYNACMTAGFTPRIIAASRIESLLSLAGINKGIALLSETAKNIYQLSNVKVLPLVPAVSCDVVLTWKTAHTRTEHQQCFLDFMIEQTRDINE